MGRIIFKELRKATRSMGAAGLLAATVLHPAAATADPALYGFTAPSPVFGERFGAIDPITGSFTQIGSATGLDDLSIGHYAPVYDPTRNVFYVTDVPTSTDSSFNNIVHEINVSTGALTSFTIPGPGTSLMGLGVAASPTTPVPEPGSALQLLAYLLGFAVVANKGLGSRLSRQEHQPDS